MGMGPVPAVNMLDRLDMSIEDFDIIESNEAFAQACAVSKSLGLDPEKVNRTVAPLPLAIQSAQQEPSSLSNWCMS